MLLNYLNYMTNFFSGCDKLKVGVKEGMSIPMSDHIEIVCVKFFVHNVLRIMLTSFVFHLAHSVSVYASYTDALF